MKLLLALALSGLLSQAALHQPKSHLRSKHHKNHKGKVHHLKASGHRAKAKAPEASVPEVKLAVDESTSRTSKTDVDALTKGLGFDALADASTLDSIEAGLKDTWKNSDRMQQIAKTVAAEEVLLQEQKNMANVLSGGRAKVADKQAKSTKGMLSETEEFLQKTRSEAIDAEDKALEKVVAEKDKGSEVISAAAKAVDQGQAAKGQFADIKQKAEQAETRAQEALKFFTDWSVPAGIQQSTSNTLAKPASLVEVSTSTTMLPSAASIETLPLTAAESLVAAGDSD